MKFYESLDDLVEKLLFGMENHNWLHARLVEEIYPEKCLAFSKKVKG